MKFSGSPDTHAEYGYGGLIGLTHFASLLGMFTERV
jgi:hypothetical protein